jgi:hypothetical protein
VGKQTAASQGLRGKPRWAPSRPVRLATLAAAVAVAAIAVGVIASSASSGSGPSAASQGAAGLFTSASPAVFKRALIAKLGAQHADFQWINCVRNGRRYEGVAVVRCNVEFGEPHVEAYCSVLRGGRLLTSQDDPAIPCAPDDVGFSAPIHTYN